MRHDPTTGSAPRSAAAVASFPGRLAERFDVVAIIAEGGMSTVYEALDRQTGRRVAVKRLKSGDEDADRLASRFLREAEVLRRLEHPNIVKLLDVSSDHGQHHIIMEYVPG